VSLNLKDFFSRNFTLQKPVWLEGFQFDQRLCWHRKRPLEAILEKDHEQQMNVSFEVMGYPVLENDQYTMFEGYAT
jgi:hypothetical protein